MANSTIVVALLFGILVCLQASSCTASLLVSVPAVMTLNGFQQGEGGGGPAACDGQYHSDGELIVSLSSQWFDCDNEVGASAHIWRNFNIDPSVGEVTINISDVYPPRLRITLCQ
jgi:hypothetical protein